MLSSNTIKIVEKNFMHSPDEFQRLIKPSTREYQIYARFINEVCRIPDEIIAFRFYITKMLDHYFENLKKRNAEHYAFGVYKFFSDKEAQRMLASLLPPIPEYMFMQTREAMIEYNTMPSPDDEWNAAIALALEYKDKAEAGKITDSDLKEIYDKM